MIWIVFENHKYFFRTWKVQCLDCRSTVEGPDGSCFCNKVVIKEGRRVSEGIDYRDVSLWTSETGKVLPLHVIDHYYGLHREANEARADTEAGASASGRTNTGGVNIKDRKGG